MNNMNVCRLAAYRYAHQWGCVLWIALISQEVQMMTGASCALISSSSAADMLT